MNSDEVKYIQRKINFKNMEVHPTDQALILNCEVAVTLILDQLEPQSIERSREFQKVIALNGLKESSDNDLLANEIIARTKGLLSANHRNEIKLLLNYLQKRQISSNQTATGANLDNFRPKTATQRSSTLKPLENSCNIANEHDLNRSNLKKCFYFFNETVKDLNWKEPFENDSSINHLDRYIELLYEDFPEKLKGAALIFSLTTNHENLILLVSNETLNCALTRLLREDGKKNLDLSIIIVATFASFSVYHQFHAMITKYKVGSLCIDLIQAELEKEEAFYKELTQLQNLLENEMRSISNSLLSHSLTLSSSISSSSLNQSFSSRFGSNSLTAEYEKSLKKFQSMIIKQNQFLQIAFFLLFNLSEDQKIEIKMVNKGVILFLIKCLDRENCKDLIILVIQFLKKLSIFAENKQKMYQFGIIDKLHPLVSSFASSFASSSLTSSPSRNSALITAIFELLLNLSFDLKLRNDMIKIGVLNELIQLSVKKSLTNMTIERLIFKLLYQFSLDDKIRIMFNFNATSSINCITKLTEKAIQHLTDQKQCSFLELMALLINLSTNRKNAPLMCEKDHLPTFLDQVFKKEIKSVTLNEILILKLIRNLSHHNDEYKMIFHDYIDLMVELLVTKDSNLASRLRVNKVSNNDFEENLTDLFIIETLAIIGNMNSLPRIDWLKIVQKHDFFTWIESYLVLDNYEFEDDLILECVITISTLCLQKECCKFLLDKGCLQILINLLNAKQEKDEIVLQIVYTLHIMLKDEEIRKMIVKEDSPILGYFFDLMNDKNIEIRKLCKQSLSLILEHDSSLGEEIKMQKFKSHNKQWLEMIVSNKPDEDTTMEDGDIEIANFNSSNFLMKPESLNESFLQPSYFMEDLNKEEYPKSSSRPQTGYKRRSSSRASQVTNHDRFVSKSKFNTNPINK